MTAELLDLLREARTFVYVAASRLREDGRETSTEKAISVCRQIDAALAEGVSPCVSCAVYHQDLDEVEAGLALAETQLKEIVELVGEGGDGSAFGSVESMLSTFDHRQKVWLAQRDAARAEVERLRAALAERQDSAKDVVEWQMTNSPIGTMHAYLDGVDLRVRWDGQDAAWDATRYGRCATEAEARRAATAAARGMR
jgi:hypothetical protein